MKKLLAMLGATGLVVSTGAILVSCNEKEAPVDKSLQLSVSFEDYFPSEDGKVTTIKDLLGEEKVAEITAKILAADTVTGDAAKDWSLGAQYIQFADQKIGEVVELNPALEGQLNKDEIENVAAATEINLLVNLHLFKGEVKSAHAFTIKLTIAQKMADKTEAPEA